MFKGAVVILEEAFRSMVRDEVRNVVREELESSRSSTRTIVPVAAPVLDLWLTVPEVARRCGAHEATVREWIKTKRLKGSKPSRHYLVRSSDLERFLSTQEPAPESTPDAAEEAARVLGRLSRRK